jgi:hypothetical protein
MRGVMDIPEGMQYCTECETIKSEEDFLKINKPGWKVTYCNACVAKKMAAWRKQGVPGSYGSKGD